VSASLCSESAAGDRARAAPVPRPVSPASLLRQLCRSLRARLDDVSAHGRPGGDVLNAVRVLVREAELSPLALIAAQQRAAVAEVATRGPHEDEEDAPAILRTVQRGMRR